MASVLESINKKIEELGIGQVYENIFDAEGDYSIVELSDPREYKEFFRLDDLGINKSFKSSVLEVKNSECKIYYILDSALISITLSCKFQPIEVTKELPLATIAFLRVLSAKKAPIELNVYENKLHIIFEDTVTKTTTIKVEQKLIETVVLNEEVLFESTIPKKKQKKERPVAKKYTLEISLRNLDKLDKEVLDFTEALELNTSYYEFIEPFELPISVKDYDPQFNVYKITNTTYGNFKSTNICCNSGLVISVIQCPILRSKNMTEEVLVMTPHNEEEIYRDSVELVEELLLVEENDNDE